MASNIAKNTMVFATSLSYHGMNSLGYRSQFSEIEILLASSKIITFDENMACPFLIQCYLEMQDHNEQVTLAGKIAGYILGFMSKDFETIGRATEVCA